MLPEDIEKRSFEIIESELNVTLDEKLAPVIKRVIHTTADFSYVETLAFSENVIDKAHKAIANGAFIVTDTNMAKAGINAAKLSAFGGEVLCFMKDDDVAARAKADGLTRAVVSMDKAVRLQVPLIFAIGNAPTALLRLCELVRNGEIKPELIIGVPVGFVNVVESKEQLMETDVPYIAVRGRKGGSTVAAAICNALIYNIKI